MKIGIVIGSIRDGRKGEAVANWALGLAQERGGAEYELIDLKALDLPLLTSATLPAAAKKQYADQRTQAWSDLVDACDGYIFVTPEYNHSVPGGFKNAFDLLGNEWLGKTVGFVSYGADNGVRAVEHWRQIVVNFQMVDVRAIVALGLFTDFPDGVFTPLPRRKGEFESVLDQLLPATARQLA